MNTYQITIGQYVGKKNTWNTYKTIIVNSKNTKDELIFAYQKQYYGFTVMVEEVKTVEVKLPEKQDTLEQTVITSVRKNDGEFGDGKYHATIHRDDINNYDALKAPIIEAEKKLDEAKKEFEQQIKKMFGLKRIDNFRLAYEGVTFSYYQNWFDFKGELTKSEN